MVSVSLFTISFPFFLGLWCVCFHDFEDPRHWYETKFTGCWWVFEEEYYIIHDVLLPGRLLQTEPWCVGEVVQV